MGMFLDTSTSRGGTANAIVKYIQMLKSNNQRLDKLFSHRKYETIR